MAALDTRVCRLLGTRYPIVQAPMAGGFTTPELVAAVSNAGGLGSLGGAILSPDDLREAIAAVRRLTDRPFGVNLFAPLPPPEVDADAIAAMHAVLAPFRAELGLPETPDVPSPPPSGLVEAQLAVVAEERVPVLSFTFGALPLEAVREAVDVVVGTATTVAEAVELERLGVDAVVAQSGEAGGHRGTFLGPFEDAVVGGVSLVPRIVDRVTVPVLLAGGIMDGRGIAAALVLGAEGVQLGTAFLGCPESGASEPLRRALAGSGDATVVSRAYSGRQARLVRTRLVEAIETAFVDPLPYPVQAVVTADLRAAALAADRADLSLVLSGQAAGALRALPAAELVETLARETEDAIRRLAADETGDAHRQNS
ncbi:MAG TPA: nitronate monooxygenase family protein [Gaiella sp.]|nr:nitronate monooxygenase family protein [Gaiella sp.]